MQTILNILHFVYVYYEDAYITARDIGNVYIYMDEELHSGFGSWKLFG